MGKTKSELPVTFDPSLGRGGGDRSVVSGRRVEVEKVLEEVMRLELDGDVGRRCG